MKEFLIFILLLLAIIGGHSYSVVPYDLATFLIFILVVGLLIYRDRGKVKFDKIIFMRRTQKGKNFIDRTAKASPGFWGVLGTVGVVVGIVMLVLGSFFLISQAGEVAAGSKEGGVRLLLPGPVSAPTSLPGVFVVPWWIWVIGVAVVIIPHEFMHGIMCRIDNVKIKSVGWILLIIIPGAFVEPDERQLKKAKRSTRLRVYAAGSFANILIAMIVLLVLASYSAASFSSSGVFVQAINDTPAHSAGLSGTITEINGQPVRLQEDVREIVSRYSPGDTVTIKTLGGDLVVPQFKLSGADFFVPKATVVTNETQHTYQLTLTKHPENEGAYIGVLSLTQSVRYNGDAGSFVAYQTIVLLLMWIYVFNLGIGIVNILPIKPLDGGLLFEDLVGHFTKRNQIVVKIVSGVMLFVLLFNLVGPVLM